MIWGASKMILGLGVCLVLLYLFVRVMKKTSIGRGDLPADSGIRLLATKPIAPQKYVSLVEIGGEVLALGISETQITLLTKIENREFVDKMSARGPIPFESFSFFNPFSKHSRRLKGGFLKISHGK
jgi:flagellar protein FliO/FliZ